MTEKPANPDESMSPSGAARSSAPSVLIALGLIVLYFLMQAAAGAIVSLIVGAVERIRHPDLSHADLHGHVMALLQRPDSNALFVIVGLPLIALVMLSIVHRKWPALWSLAPPQGFGFAPAASAYWYVWAFIVGVVAPPLGGVLTELLAHGQTVSQNVEELSRHASENLRLPLAIVMVIVGPLIEELLFRGVLLSALMRRLSTAWSITISAVLFGVVHLEGLDFKWFALPGLILLAVGLAWLRLKSSSLWPAVVAHGVYNLFALIALFATIAGST
ncbi:type II CAAX endopeptidase family protein [Dyella sp.]|jgi:membrane protease YdiL (CAAX protease family)|uniref:CPBP family intramembrane glutamic endopeptidase n=1 Tax=Dyella sp. TaxID=1869338 RepID=UPI002C8A3E07|nr:type II CAAX endopeptidase family protein [Dyella sp.]HTC28444.1 type II CAAX endopeptidase family protein [Dyella sp.]